MVDWIFPRTSSICTLGPTPNDYYSHRANKAAAQVYLKKSSTFALNFCTSVSNVKSDTLKILKERKMSSRCPSVVFVENDLQRDKMTKINFVCSCPAGDIVSLHKSSFFRATPRLRSIKPLYIHFKLRYNIVICLVILGELESFRNC